MAFVQPTKVNYKSALYEDQRFLGAFKRNKFFFLELTFARVPFLCCSTNLQTHLPQDSFAILTFRGILYIIN